MDRACFDEFDFPDLFANEPIIPMITPAEGELIKMLPSELKALNDKVDRMEAALRTQTLLLTIERTKRQKLKLLVKQRQQEIPITHPEVLKRMIETNASYQETINFQLSGGIDRLSTLAFRGLSRMQQLITFILPSVTITSSDSPDAASLLEEIGRVIQQLCVHQTIPPNP